MTQLDTSDSSPANLELSAEQHALLADVVRQAVLSDQHDERQRLRDAVPQLVMALDTFCHHNAWQTEQSRQAVIEKFWPMNSTMKELPLAKFEGCFSEYDGVKEFVWFAENCDRTVSVDLSQTQIMVVTNEEQATNSDTYEEDGEIYTSEDTHYTETHFLVLSKRLALKIVTHCGDYSDDDNDASMTATLLMSQDPAALLGAVRRHLHAMGSEVKMGDVEPRLETVFGSDYATPVKSKGLQP